MTFKTYWGRKFKLFLFTIFVAVLFTIAYTSLFFPSTAISAYEIAFGLTIPYLGIALGVLSVVWIILGIKYLIKLIKSKKETKN